MSKKIWPFIALLALFGCSAPGKPSTYSPPAVLKQAPVQRQQFVDSFLQGNWCESETLFVESIDTYLRQDNVCQAAYTYELAHRLKQYVGIEDNDLLLQAKRYSQLGFGCSDKNAFLPEQPTVQADKKQPHTDRNSQYLDLLDKVDFAALVSLIENEKDELFASHYGRRIVSLAILHNEQEIAKSLLERTHTLDAEQGWVVFLREDWKLALQLDARKEVQGAIMDRITELENYIRPCDTY